MVEVYIEKMRVCLAAMFVCQSTNPVPSLHSGQTRLADLLRVIARISEDNMGVF